MSRRFRAGGLSGLVCGLGSGVRSALLLSIAALGGAGPASGVTFSDGFEHTIDAANSFPFEGAQILDGPGATVTSVVVVDGGAIGTFNPDNVDAMEGSSVEVRGGDVGGSLRGFGTASISVSGGAIGGDLRIGENSFAELSGGSFRDAFVEGAASLSTTGTLAETASILSLKAFDDASVVVSSLQLNQFEARDASTVEIRGIAFDQPPGPVSDTIGIVSGQLEDGRNFSWPFQRDPTATITLVLTGDTVSIDQGGVYHKAIGKFYLRSSPYATSASSGEPSLVQRWDTEALIVIGGGGGLPVAGDWDGDGQSGLGFFDTTSGTWFLIEEAIDSQAATPADYAAFITTDGSGWLPVTGDWDGDGSDGIGIFSVTSGAMFLVDDPTQGASAPSPADYSPFMVVDGSDWIPIAGDWDGDGQDGIGLYNTISGAMFLANDATIGGAVATFIPADISLFMSTDGPSYLPVAGSWRGLVADGVGIWDKDGGAFYLSSTLAPGANASDVLFYLYRDPWFPGDLFRAPNYVPVMGAWSGL